MNADLAETTILPKILHGTPHRLLERIDLEIIFRGAAGWWLFYAFLLFTGLRSDIVAMLVYGNIDRKKRALVNFMYSSRYNFEYPLVDVLLDPILDDQNASAPLFPRLFSNIEHPILRQQQLNENLALPNEFMQALLGAEDRPLATLHSFRLTFNETLRNLGRRLGDRQVMGIYSRGKGTRFSTHPSFDLAVNYLTELSDVFKPVGPFNYRPS